MSQGKIIGKDGMSDDSQNQNNVDTTSSLNKDGGTRNPFLSSWSSSLPTNATSLVAMSPRSEQINLIRPVPAQAQAPVSVSVTTIIPNSDNFNSSGVIDSGCWPKILDDDAAIENEILRPLPTDHDDILAKVKGTGKIAVRSVTWNQQAQALPPVEELTSYLFPREYFHIVAVGTQECENSITKSIINPYKEKWERICGEALGVDYILVRGHSLQASHLALFVHKAIVNLVSNVQSHAVATGICDTLGNKGGIGISVVIGKTSYCFLTAHLAAHQNQLVRRTNEFSKISREISRALGKINVYKDGTNHTKESIESIHDDEVEGGCFEDNCIVLGNGKQKSSPCIKTMNSCFCPTCPNSLRRSCCCSNVQGEKYNPLPHAFDHVIWAGDLNFRINGTREVVDSLLFHHRHDVLIAYDQMNMLLQFETAFAGFEEGPITFRPTYKFDKGTDTYDTSPKRRIPAWTDRILYKSSPRIELLSYCSSTGVRTSDHRPVYASFQTSIEIDSNCLDGTINRRLLRSESKSEVCVIS
uniref:Inositol polyphosphate-related phosphatase domain-containing protein n=2 Tax=Chaetoceros debilis TaxID=122233 RepID=A0A7S3PZ34_9STRA|mmetsp:Transcript_18873/g.28699  ORF Transcript_18873/g.28699 Transcript_18873/m.28699 type:complete len:529 (+) Transcript_18873:119-1705(+)